eukprot:NODE_495_length_7749_cov_0.107974.p3 type:complete len:392 gc:universal NODE_495_length_7749_cov_0.107974:100-1275(+)
MSQFRLFCDFDGTICSQDTGVIVIDYAKNIDRKELESKVLNNKQTYRDAVTRMWKSVKTPLDKANELLRGVDLDIGTSKLREFLSKRSLPLYILSNGLDVLIEPILTYHTKVNVRNNTCVQDIYLLANYGYPRPEGWEVVWRHDSEHGHDKAETVEAYLLKGETAVFVGDGISDMASVEALTKKNFPLLIFAKEGKALEKFCKTQGIQYKPFKTLVDVVTALETHDFSNSKRKAPESDAPLPLKKSKVDNKEKIVPKKSKTSSKTVENDAADGAEYKVGDFALVYVERDDQFSKCRIAEVKADKFVCEDVDDDEPFESLELAASEIRSLLTKKDFSKLSIGASVLAIWPSTTAAYKAEVLKVLKSKVQVRSMDDDAETVNVAFSDICLEVE